MKMSEIKRRRKVLLQCQELLSKHMEALAQTGLVLQKIQYEGLYRQGGCRTMEKYCMEYYSMTKKAWKGLIEIAENRDAIHTALSVPKPTEGE